MYTKVKILKNSENSNYNDHDEKRLYKLAENFCCRPIANVHVIEIQLHLINKINCLLQTSYCSFIAYA